MEISVGFCFFSPPRQENLACSQASWKEPAKECDLEQESNLLDPSQKLEPELLDRAKSLPIVKIQAETAAQQVCLQDICPVQDIFLDALFKSSSCSISFLFFPPI